MEEKEFDEKDIKQNSTFAALAYILFFLPLITCKDSKYGRFHANQGLILLIVSLIGSIIFAIISSIRPWRLAWFGRLLSVAWILATIAFIVIGVVNAVNEKAKELPIIGKFRIIK